MVIFDMYARVLCTIIFAIGQCRTQYQCPFVTGGLDKYGSRAINVHVNGIEPIICALPPLHCDAFVASPYRSLDGSCNNLRHTEWGMAFRRYGRLLDADYGDGYALPSRAASGAELPSARNVSVVMHPTTNKIDVNLTIVNMQFGQFVSHDGSLLAGSTGSLRNVTLCCTADGKMPGPGPLHINPKCYPIPVSDSFYTDAGIECLNFVRTVTDKDAQCDTNVSRNNFEVAQQLSVVTSYLDLSQVYGNTVKQCDGLRTFHRGRLATQSRNGYDWPSNAHDPYDLCDVPQGQAADAICYRTGDVRANQNTGLSVLQIVYVREHNRLASGLRAMNPFWSDERLFQEARRINIASYQRIIYAEWLPLMLGADHMAENGLWGGVPDANGYVNAYDATVEASALNEHSTAAFRYFHSQVDGVLLPMSEDVRTWQNVTADRERVYLSDNFNRPSVVETGDNYDGLIRCMCAQPQQNTDPRIDAEIRGRLFRSDQPTGQDLRAMDIQRSRDHGLPTYNAYREWSGAARAQKWNDYLDRFNEANLKKLQSLYTSFEDVEMTVGGAVEKHLNDTLAGPVFHKILMEQFRILRAADRYFYEFGHDVQTRFTPAQLAELRKATMARLMCDNSNNVQSMQPNAFRQITEVNQRISCSLIPSIDLSAWRDPMAGYEARVAEDSQRNHFVGSPFERALLGDKMTLKSI